MSEKKYLQKKYLLTLDEIRKLQDIVLSAISWGNRGDNDMVEHRQDEYRVMLAAHEYRERTCTVVAVEYDETMGARFALSCGHSTWHDGDGNAPNFCANCGSRLDHRGATDREVSG